MAVKKFVFCVLFFTNAINSAEKDDSDNKKFSISTVERDSSIPKNNYNTRKWGSIYLLFNPITHFVDYYSEYTWLTFFRIFTGDILYRYISKKGVGVMLKLGFNSSISALNKKNIIRLSPSLTLSFCWVYKKKGKKLFSGSFCPIGMGWYNIFQLKEQQTLQKNDEQDVNKEYSLITNELFQENNNEKNYNTMHIAIAGNIGSGKTTLTKLLAHRYGWTPRFEPVDNNPYLSDFYADMPRWSFNLQVYFLSKRFKEVVEISKSEDTIIQDRTIFEDAKIFAPNLHAQGMMSDRDFANYSDLFDLMMSLVKLPNLMIYIRSSIPTLVAQIQKRGRDYEQTMRLDYLKGLEERYEEWIATYKGPLIVVDGDHCKFGDNSEDLKIVTDMIDAKLYGLFPMDSNT